MGGGMMNLVLCPQIPLAAFEGIGTAPVVSYMKMIFTSQIYSGTMTWCYHPRPLMQT